MKNGVRRLLLLALLLAAAWQSGLAWPAQNTSARLASAIKKWESFERREFPEQATLRGQHEADDRLTDVSDSAVFGRRQFVSALLAEIRTLDRNGLTGQEQVSRELLTRELAQSARLASLYGNLPFGSFSSDGWLPLSSLGGPHSILVTLAQASRFASRQDYDNYLSRLEQVPDHIGNLVKRMDAAIKWDGSARQRRWSVFQTNLQGSRPRPS